MEERDQEGTHHDANDGKEEAGAEDVERFGNPIDENKVNCEGHEDCGGG